MIKLAFCKETQTYVDIKNYDNNIHKTLLCKYGHLLFPKLGKEMVHHYAHYANTSCSNIKTIWHENWQKLFRDTEVIFYKDGMRENNKHIADIVTEKKRVIEIQHSPIGIEDIKSREEIYGNMIWIFDIRNQVTGTEFICQSKDICLIKPNKKYLFLTEKETYYDCGNCLLKKINVFKKFAICKKISYLDFFSYMETVPFYSLDLLITDFDFSFSFEIDLLKIENNKIYFETSLENNYTPFLPSKYIPNRYFLPT